MLKTTKLDLKMKTLNFTLSFKNTIALTSINVCCDNKAVLKVLQLKN